EQEIVVRLDSAHDALETREALAAAENVRFLIKWNPRNSNELAWLDRMFSEGTVTTPRSGKRVGLLVVDELMQVHDASYPCKRIMRVTEWTTDRHGQLLLTPD
ncbi:MAG: IS1380 family transposase, partial [Desulfobulbus sp.]|nr:IS1380 family transposase [Desulfobulbus sp.]